MKNIHILPTDKPSKLYLGDNGNFVFGLIQSSIKSKNNNYTNQNIYITSDEEIKEGDWVYDHTSNHLGKVKNALNLKNISFKTKFGLEFGIHKKECKKIILTTDLELQKDGVQAIDDKFLEWFVKNPSCEEIEVKGIVKHSGGEFIPDYYKIIISKEEPKQGSIVEAVKEVIGNQLQQVEELRQETQGYICPQTKKTM